MKYIFLLAILSTAIHAYAQDRKIDVQHYRFELTLSDSENRIKGRALITVKFLRDAGEVEFDLVNQDTSQKGMTAYRALENGSELTSSHGNNKLILRLARPAKQNEIRTFEVLYEGVPKDGLIISKNKFNRRTFFGDNWPDRAKNWLPCVDDPADKASVEFIVTAPLHYQVVSNGVQVEETILNDQQKLTHWKEDVLLPTKIMVIGVAEFAVQYVGDTLGVPVYSWVYPQEKQNGFYDYALAKEVLAYFISNIAPFPYRKLANVQSTTIFGGMENAGCIFYSESSVAGTRKLEDLLAHEIAHQWFGDMATEKSFAHLWLSEGFATYLTDLYIGHKYGLDSMNARLTSERQKVIAYSKRSNKPVVDSLTRNYMQLLNANSYEKGAWVLHMLRSSIGEKTFLQGVQNYYKKYGGSNANTDDFRKVMEETSGKDLKSFFRQWLYTPGHPQLKITYAYDVKSKTLTMTVVQQQADPFSFPLEVSVKTAGGVVKRTFEVTKKEQAFKIGDVLAADAVVVDPGVKLLFERGN
ncbi:MAG: M1 family aminopeptidase [Chitinophagaceae bacterium]